ncbi:cell-wall lytic protein [Sinorhizobium meliloti]|nr:cell-wall lytic protein [Sinorhizobium meliloti]
MGAARMNPIVVDLSHHNSEPDWPTLMGFGTVGVIMKASEGTTYIDPTFFERRIDAQAAGLLVSSYHYLHGGQIEAQMAHYLATVLPREGERLCIDHEADATLDELVAAVKYIRVSRPDLQVTVYSGHTIKEQLGESRDAYLAENTSLWIAQYCEDAAPTWPQATWPCWSLWQYTDSAPVAGIPEPVDGNRWNGTEESLREWLAPAAPAPTPEPAIATVYVTIQRPAGVEVKVIVEEVEP